MCLQAKQDPAAVVVVVVVLRVVVRVVVVSVGAARVCTHAQRPGGGNVMRVARLGGRVLYSKLCCVHTVLYSNYIALLYSVEAGIRGLSVRCCVLASLEHAGRQCSLSLSLDIAIQNTDRLTDGIWHGHGHLILSQGQPRHIGP